jgi:hypothetical protein
VLDVLNDMSTTIDDDESSIAVVDATRSKRANVAHEILSSEQSYVRSLVNEFADFVVI